jgi:macrolide-specific efflux system membrane fusion protein
MTDKKIKWILLLVIILLAGLLFAWFAGKNKSSEESIREIQPFYGDIKAFVSTTGTVKPQNRLEIKPPVSGRVEEIRVKEGQTVKPGDVLALISATERAALLDTALLKGDREVEYWRSVYKATPLIAPIKGEVIVRSVEPGQTVTTGDAVLVLSDRLIVKADVDETDIGEIRVGQKAVISLDAYPDIRVSAMVDHISYESTLINNVTIYEVDILPETMPGVFRSGMSANVEVIVKEKTGVMLLPIEAVKEEDNRKVVSILDPASGRTAPRAVATGLQDDRNVEIVSGLSAYDRVAVFSYTPPRRSSGGNPFMPFRKRKDKDSK